MLFDPRLSPELEQEVERQLGTGVPRERLFCASCGAFITSREAELAVGGRVLHRFMNPVGILFEFKSYREAPGIRALGPHEAADSWFPGYVWQLAICGACGVHLGWSYLNGEGNHFAGLICDRLVAASEHE